MIKALFYKEWIKTKWALATITIVALSLQIYMFVRLGRSLRFAGHEHLWDVIINQNQFMFSEFKYFPLLSGIVLGLFQFVPEAHHKRMRITLHLPMKEFSIISWMTGFGLSFLTIIFLFQASVMFGGMALLFQPEFILSGFFTVLPWFVAGIIAYISCVFICTEPTWKRRIPNALLAAGVLRFFYLTDLPGAYSKSLLLFLVLMILTGCVIIFSMYRFKVGLQD